MKKVFSRFLGTTFLIFFISLPLISVRPSTLPDSHNSTQNIPAISPLNDRPSTETRKK